MLKFNDSKYNHRDIFSGGGGGLYMEGVFRFKSWFLNARGLYTMGLIIGILRYISISTENELVYHLGLVHTYPGIFENGYFFLHI